MVNDLDCVIASKQSSEPFLADHDLISFEYNYSTPSQRQKIIQFRNLASIDNQRLNNLCTNLNVDMFSLCDSVDEMNVKLHNKIQDVIDIIAPVKTKVVRESAAPWIAKYIRDLQRRRSKLYRIYKRTEFAYKEFVQLRKLVKQRIIEAKKKYFETKFFSTVRNSKSIWNDFRALGLIKRDDSDLPTDLNLEHLNEFFINIAGRSNDLDFEYIDYHALRCVSVFSFGEVNPIEVKHALMRISSTSVGPDGY